MNVTIYHNPGCETSRAVLSIIQAAGVQPTIIDYLEVGWTLELLEYLLESAGLTPRQALREAQSPAKALNLLAPGTPDEVILAHMLREPILVNRPFVKTDRGVKLCRPPETVLEILDRPAGAPGVVREPSWVGTRESIGALR